MEHYLAFDLGASSGRAILGSVSADSLEIREIHRFDNGAVDINGGLFWNLLGLFAELKHGLRRAFELDLKISGVAIDTWGVDFALLDRTGQFVGFPRHYRDPRNAGILDYVFARIRKEHLYARTGIQFLDFNSLFQLAAMQRDQDPALANAHRLLMMPNALTYLLCGAVSAEYTVATTSQALDPGARDWAWDLIDALELPRTLFPPIVEPGTVAGALRTTLCAELHCPAVPVILVGSHDTASAVAAVPAVDDGSWAYLSSGTWSLLGIERREPLITPQCLALNYTNEGGIGGTIRFLKNIMGLWLVQECRAQWEREGSTYSFAELTELAAAAPPFRALIDPNDACFVAPGNMPARIAAFCRKTGQPEPKGPGQIVRCALESLALRYRQTVEEIESLSGQRVERLHLVGGGSRNKLLNQCTADALGRPVITGPVEATAIGNILCQALATGQLRDLKQARSLVRRSFPAETCDPRAGTAWGAAYERYRAFLQ